MKKRRHEHRKDLKIKTATNDVFPKDICGKDGEEFEMEACRSPTPTPLEFDRL